MRIFLPIIFSVILISCQLKNDSANNSTSEQSHPKKQKSAESILAQLKKPTKDRVLVVSHRGDWRNAPENSIKAVQNCIEMGVDIVEIDVRMTLDSQLVIIHDKTLNRTTSGKGKVDEWPLDSIKTLYLKNGAGGRTAHQLPTLRELMEFVKDKPILINLDKAWDYLPQTYALLKETNTVKQGIFKGNEPIELMKKKYGNYMDSVLYMPMVWPLNYSIYKRDSILHPIDYTKGYIENYEPIAFEVIYDQYDSSVMQNIEYMTNNNTSVWINTLWDELCAGHTDEKALEQPDDNWGWVIEKGANVIQTDRPQLLLDYLREKELHD
ncbi:glycerophosphodiester phosphodiesterase family protein [Flammeovirgaceae bacterium SG7u.111]|nr:glycerophosphodiester phosphodiesterase family protein [Flammeovirgaceae bacterium SG7u.132]WPO34619.1 glycerophosphodiester phosphodiesterase family protein [Flammeovirgaceae bacterium SG7u.111]